MNPLALTDACDQVLAHVVAALAQPGAPAAPERRYVAPCDPPADCDLIAVWAAPSARPDRRGVPQTCHIAHQAQITVRQWRCLPTGNPIPDRDALDAAGHEHLTSVWVVWAYLADRILAGDLIEGLACSEASLVSPAALTPEAGGYVGWTITLNVDLYPLLHDAAS